MAQLEKYWNGMAWVYTPMTLSLLGGDTKCLICGESATAYWAAGGVDIRVCRHCAVEKLPLLIADAIAGPLMRRPGQSLPHQFSPFQQSVDAILANYWRGVAIALSRRLDPLRSDPLEMAEEFDFSEPSGEESTP